MANFLIFLSPFSLFSMNIMGFELYPLYLFFPLGIMVALSRLHGGRSMYVTRTSIIFAAFICLVVLSALTRLYLVADLFKIAIMSGTLWGICYTVKKDMKSFAAIVDTSILVLVLYGVFQYVMVLTGNTGVASWLHDLVGYEGHGGPVDSRGGITRVASLTKEPSYFAFIVGIYLFITKKRIVRAACIIGLLVSFSLITVYSVSGIIFYRICRFFKIRMAYILSLIVMAHVLFVVLYFDLIPALLLPTFEDRYAGIVYLLSEGSLWDWVLGATHLTLDDPINLVHPYSNIGSVLLLYGAVGMVLYLLFITSIAKKGAYPYAAYALFLFSINFYYLTAWPIILIFLAFFTIPQHAYAEV